MAVSEEQVPPHLEEANKHYFGTIRRELKRKAAESGAGGSAPAKPAEAPAAAP